MKKTLILLLILPFLGNAQLEVTFEDQFYSFVNDCDLHEAVIVSTETREGDDLSEVLRNGDFQVAPEYRANNMLIDLEGAVIWQGREPCSNTLMIYYVGGKSRYLRLAGNTRTEEQYAVIARLSEILKRKGVPVKDPYLD